MELLAMELLSLIAQKAVVSHFYRRKSTVIETVMEITVLNLSPKAKSLHCPWKTFLDKSAKIVGMKVCRQLH